MNNKPLVSIIIPTYNRANLIGETLESIVAQTYTNWECIIVDDGSTDATASVVENYTSKDSRFTYLKRPDNRAKGGNAARNYGFEVSSGDLIQWFDSDDLMVKDKLEQKVKLFERPDVDFVVSKTKYFNKENKSFKNYEFIESDVSFINYAIGSINWFTPDLMVRREVAETIRYNEELKAGQEYNLNCNMLSKTTRIGYLQKFTTLRRAHNDSIGSKRRSNRKEYLTTKFEQHWITYKDVFETVKSSAFNKYSLLKCVICFFESKNEIKLPSDFKKHLKKEFKWRILFFTFGVVANRYFSSYYFFYKQLKK